MCSKKKSYPLSYIPPPSPLLRAYIKETIFNTKKNPRRSKRVLGESMLCRIRTSLSVVIQSMDLWPRVIFFYRGPLGPRYRGPLGPRDRGKKNITRGHRSIDWITTDMEVRILHNIDLSDKLTFLKFFSPLLPPF